MSFVSELTGCFSQPAADNPTVAMVEAAYRDLGIDWRYLNCDVPPESLASAVDGARAMGWRGFHCSLPHKITVIEHLDGLSTAASLIGAVNCVVRDEGKLIGENTDGKGFVESLQAVVDLAGKTMVLIGAGGAARAIGVECALAGLSRIVVVNRSEHSGRELAGHLDANTPATASFERLVPGYAIPGNADLVVNGTSVGLAGTGVDTLALDFDSLGPAMTVCDVIPNPPTTPLLAAAHSRGCVTVDGLGMLVNQGVLAIAYWTGLQPDAGVMRQALVEALDL